MVRTQTHRGSELVLSKNNRMFTGEIVPQPIPLGLSLGFPHFERESFLTLQKAMTLIAFAFFASEHSKKYDISFAIDTHEGELPDEPDVNAIYPIIDGVSYLVAMNVPDRSLAGGDVGIPARIKSSIWRQPCMLLVKGKKPNLETIRSGFTRQLAWLEHKRIISVENPKLLDKSTADTFVESLKLTNQWDDFV